MPSSETYTEPRKLANLHGNNHHPLTGAPPQEQEHLPCPRCDSTNTKFCYYNNYNFSQPRHFCKSCRRYWTHGGSLRDIPVGGGTRKNAKRSRTSATLLCPVAATTHVPLMANQGHLDGGGGGGVPSSVLCGSFTSLLNTQGPAILGLGGFGIGLGIDFDDLDFGLGRGVWPFSGVGDGGHVGGGVTRLSNTWQFESRTENGFVGGVDCFSWPDLAISTPGNCLK